MATHWNTCCSVCKKTSFRYCRYKCLRCYNYNLCSDCHDNELIKSTHIATHPFQCVLDRSALELYFAGDDIPVLFADSFTCPYCGLMGHTPEDLVQHVRSFHRLDPTYVICPLCVAMPSMRATLMPRLGLHLSVLHDKESLVFTEVERSNRNTPPPPAPPPSRATPQLPFAALNDFFGNSLGFDPDAFSFGSSSLSLPDLDTDSQHLRRAEAHSNLASNPNEPNSAE